MIEIIKKYIYKTILIILAIFVTYVTFCSIYNIYKSPEELKPLILIIGACVFVFFFITFKRIIKKIPDKKANIIAICLCIVFFISLSIFGLNYTSIPTYDLSQVIREVQLMLQNNGKFITEGYFSVYSNQVPLTVFVYYIYKLGNILGVGNLKAFAIVINSLFTAITAFFVYLSVKRKKDCHRGLITLLFFVINPMFYIYSSYFYADTLCMPFAAIAIYVFLISREENKKRKKIFFEFLIGFILAIGFRIRVVLGILLIAILFCKLISKENKRFVGALIILLGFVLGFLTFKIIENKSKPLINENLKFPITHWIMLGSNYETDGRWNAEDYVFTQKGTTYYEKKEKDIIKIKDRIRFLGPSGIVSFAKKKLAVNWSNGSYDYISKFLNVEKINSFYAYLSGNKKVFFTYYYQICKIVILALFLISIFGEINNKEGIYSKYNYIYIGVFGAFIFYLFWEVLTRYSLTFLPWMILTFSVGIEYIEKFLDARLLKFEFNNNKAVTINFMKVKKLFPYIILSLSVFIIIINYQEYTIKKKAFYDKRVVQASLEQGQLIPKISNKKIEQTFETDKSFNRIAIYFTKDNSTTQTHYNFILKNKDGKILVNQNFTSDLITNNKLFEFKFKKIKPNERQKYTIHIYSNDASENNSIGIATYYQEGYDVYHNGNLSIDGKEYKGDLTFQVINVVERPYISKKVYILISFFVILIEIFAFYPFLTYNRSVKEIEGGI